MKWDEQRKKLTSLEVQRQIYITSITDETTTFLQPILTYLKYTSVEFC